MAKRSLRAVSDAFEPRQMPLGLALDPKLSRDDIIVGKSNRAAVEIIDLWPAWPSPVVALCGPNGSGKTHLARAWAAKAGARGLNAAEPASFLVPDASSQAFFIEDLGEAALDETALFHLLNSIRQQDGSLLLTSKLRPANWSLALPDLKSRLQSATVVEIGEPDDALLLAVLTKLFADRQVIVEPNVSEYLVTRMERSFSEAARIVDALDALALEKKARITRALAASLFASGDPRQAELGF
jgi:chromosomal replication initiation ATPase DnaA